MIFTELRQIALSFPGVEEHTVYGGPTFRIGKRFLASIAKIDPDTIVLKVPDRRERDYFLQAKPEVYYLTDHYVSFECLLVRLPLADYEEVCQLFKQAWLTYAPKRLVKAYKAQG